MSTDPRAERLTVCPRCTNPQAVWLPRMRAHDPLRDWFHCEKCDHFFTINRLHPDGRVVEDSPTTTRSQPEP